MIKNILWDFDGVILDSMKIKGEGFVALFSNYDKSYQDALYDYHIQHGGISRFEKIRYFYNVLLQQEVDEQTVQILAEKFGNIVSDKLLDPKNLIEDSINFIRNNYKKYHFHIVSGAEENELQYLCSQLKLTDYFLSINGSPTPKNILVKNVLKMYDYDPKQTVLIGDAMTDYEASKANDIAFYGYNNPLLRKFDYIENFNGFHFEQ